MRAVYLPGDEFGLVLLQNESLRVLRLRCRNPVTQCGVGREIRLVFGLRTNLGAADPT